MTTGFGYCPSCGTALTASEQAFCGACGSGLPAAPSVPPAAGVSSSSSGQPPAGAGYAPAAPTKTRISPLLLIGGLVIVVVVGAGAFLRMNSHPGGITINPSIFSCSSSQQVSSIIRLPASLNGSDQLTIRFDGLSVGTETVSPMFQQQYDGTWQNTGTHTASSQCVGPVMGPNGQLSAGQLVMGMHTLQIVDSKGNVLAGGSYMTTP